MSDMNSSSNPPTLPQELIGSILDHLQEDSKTLQACSLVCRSWINPSYTFYFQTITIRQAPTLQNFIENLRSGSVFASFIRSLSYDGCAPKYQLGAYDATQQLSPHLISTILSFLPRLNTIVLKNVILTTPFHYDLASQGPKSALLRLLLWGCVVIDPLDLVHTLQNFEEIMKLDILGLTSFNYRMAMEEDFPVDVPEIHRTRVNGLFFDDRCWGFGTKHLNFASPSFLKDQLIPSHLRSFIMALSERFESSLIEPLIVDDLPRLEKFGIDVRPRQRYSLPLDCLHWFERLESLKHLALKMVLDSDALEDLKTAWTDLFRILNKLPSNSRTSLQSFKITLNIYGSDTSTQLLMPSDWDQLSQCLEEFKALERVDFVWEVSIRERDWLEQVSPLNPDPYTIDTLIWVTGPDTISNMMPRLHSRGLLHFSTIDTTSW